jgi:hypothetical protein
VLCSVLMRPSTLRENVINSVLREMEPERGYSSEGQRDVWCCVPTELVCD